MSTVTLHGLYFDGCMPIGAATTLVFAGPRASLVGEKIVQQYATSALHVSPRIGAADRFIQLPDGGQFQCPDDPALDQLPHDSQGEGLVAWLEARVAMAVVGIALIVAFVTAGYFYGVPAAAERVVKYIPIESEVSLGQYALTWLDDNKWFEPSQVDAETRLALKAEFDELRRDLPLAAHTRLEFRKAGFAGANAFAFPGGIVIVTDDMVNEAESFDELMAVLAHELGHVEHRHTLRHLLQGSAVAVAVSALTADVASLSVAVAGLPALLAQANYSRRFETEADDFAFDLLKRNDRSPEDFATIMERLLGENEETENSFAFLSTHPMTRERIDRARAAASPR